MEYRLSDLVDKHHKMFPDGFYFECLPGWYALIDTLCLALQERTDLCGDPQIVAVQIKEKYGTLRFYVDAASEEQFALIDLAEHASAQTCDICGALGTLVSDGWMRARCERHRRLEQRP